MLLSQTSTWNNWPISLTQPRLLYERFAAELIANWSITNFIGHICKRMDYAKFERPTSLSLNQKFCLSLSQSHIFLFLPLSFTFLLFWVIFAFPQNLTFDFLGGPPRLAFGLWPGYFLWRLKDGMKKTYILLALLWFHEHWLPYKSHLWREWKI